MRRFESKFGQTGGIFEWQYINKVDIQNPKYQKALHQAQEEESKEGQENGYLRFKKSVELVKEFQPFDPLNPDKPFARDIRISLIDLLIGKGWIEDTEEDMDRGKFYTAVGTPLDKFHSADAFIEYQDKNGKTYRVTIDLTLNPHKKSYKDNVVVSELPDPNLEDERLMYLAKVEKYAQE